MQAQQGTRFHPHKWLPPAADGQVGKHSGDDDGGTLIALGQQFSKSGFELEYHNCLIATGATPFLPQVEGIGSDRIYSMRTIEDAIRLKKAIAKKPEKALVIGASMVGIKLVELFYNSGVEVCLADLAQNIFPLTAHPECARVIRRTF